jgi:periplasmic copper chaperone A
MRVATRFPLALAAAVLAAGMGLTGGPGQDVEHEGLIVSGATALSNPAAPTAAGYFTLTNTSGRDDRLVAVESDAAQRVELHAHELTDGVARMIALEAGVEVPAGATVVLERGGLHVMFMGLDEQWGAEGGVVVTLVFEQAGAFPVTLAVDRVGHRHDPQAHDDHPDERHDQPR